MQALQRRAQALQQRHSLRVLHPGEEAGPATPSHVGRGLSEPCDHADVRALRYQIADHLVIPAGGCIVERRVAPRVPKVDIGAVFVDQVLQDRHELVGDATHAERSQPEPSASRGAVHGVRTRHTLGNRRQPRIFLLAPILLPALSHSDGWPRSRNVRVCAVRGEKLHRVEVLRERRPPERGRALQVDPQLGETIFPVPQVGVQSHVRIGASLQESAQHLHVLRLLIVVRPRLRVIRLGCPLCLEHRKQRRNSIGGGGQVGIRPALDQKQRDVELAIERRHQQRTRSVAATDLVRAGATIEQPAHRFDMALSSRV